MNASLEHPERKCIFCGKRLSACMEFVVLNRLRGFLEICQNEEISRKIMRVEVCGRCEIVATVIIGLTFPEASGEGKYPLSEEEPFLRGEN